MKLRDLDIKHSCYDKTEVVMMGYGEEKEFSKEKSSSGVLLVFNE